LEPWTIYSKW